jgi:hypothetical protein
MQPIKTQVSDEIPRRYVNLCDWPIILFGNFISNRVKGYDFYDDGQVVLKGLTAARVLILEPVPIVIGGVADGCSINASTVVSEKRVSPRRGLLLGWNLCFGPNRCEGYDRADCRDPQTFHQLRPDHATSTPALIDPATRSGEYRQAAGAIALVIATLLSRQCGYSAVSLVSRMNFFQFGASCSFPESISFNW